MDGGGLRLLAPGLTNADAIAHAIIGAARAYGDDPVSAVLAPVKAGSGGRAGRAVIAAISALATQTGDRQRLARLFGRTPQTIRTAQISGRRSFDDAEIAARKAVEIAQVRARLAWALAEDAEPHAAEGEASSADLLPSPEDVRGILKPAPAGRFGGAITGHLAPAQIERSGSAPPPAVGALSDRLLETLARGPRNTMSLATELGVKETVVGQCLSALRHEKRVRSDASAGLGRALLWLLPEREAAA